MRPLTPSLREDAVHPGDDLSTLLARQRGRSCAICERPLFTGGLVWDPLEDIVRTVPFPAAENIDDPGRMLLLCDDCWVAYRSWTGLPETLPLPTEAPPVAMRFHDDGRIEPADDAALVLVAAFRLEGADGFDLRRALRSGAVVEAHRLVDELADREPRTCRILRRRIWASGCVSAWAQALPRDLLDLAFSSAWDEVFPNPAPGSPPEWYLGTAAFAPPQPAIFR